MAVVPSFASKPLKICAWIDGFVFGGEVVEDFGGCMDACGRLAHSSFGRWLLGAIDYELLADSQF